MSIHDKHRAWIEARGLDPKLAEAFGLKTVLRGGKAWLSVPYVEDGVEVNHKYRLTSEKDHRMDDGAPLALWNSDCLRDPRVRSGQAPVVITEGEWDALAAIQSGFPCVVSVPNGAPSNETKDLDNAKRYEWVDRHANDLAGVKEFIIAVDDDQAGHYLRADLVALLGADRCRFAEYPWPSKDLNEVLLEHGQTRASECLTMAKPFPVQGLYKPSDFPEKGEVRSYPVGVEPISEMIQIVPGTLTVVTGYANMGKALALDTPIPTPGGWTTMGDLRIGDEIFSADGSVCRVQFTSDIQHNRTCYAVKFRDGESIIADADHLWLTDTVASRNSARNKRRRGDGPVKSRGTDQTHKRQMPSIKTTSEIAATLYVDGRHNHSIARAGELRLPDIALPLDPYLLGVWLGDGHTSAGAITSADSEIPRAFADAGFPTRSVGLRHNVRQLIVQLRGVGVFNNKHVPTAYKRSSPSQRLAILQGLMDSDGHCDKNGACEFVSINETLARDVFELVVSLGVKASFATKTATLYGKDCGAKHLVRFHTELPVFRLQRKLDRLPERTTSRCDRFIVSCEPVPSVPVRCIQVDHPSRLFLAGRSMVPTHNTTLINAIMAHTLTRHFPVCIASFETDVKPILIQGLQMAMMGCGKHDLPHLDLSDANRLIEDRLTIISQNVDEDLEMDLAKFLELARLAVIRHGAKMIVLDPWNELEHKSHRNETETEYIGRAIRAIKRFAKQYDVAFWIVAHPTKPHEGSSKIPGLYDISGSANFANKADYGLTYHRPKFDENEAFIIVNKVRMGLPGKRGKAKVMFDFRRSVFERLPD